MHVLILPSWYFKKGTSQLRGRMFHQHAHALRKQGIDARILVGEFNFGQPLLKKIIRSKEDNIPTWRIKQWFPPKINAYLIKLWVRKYVTAIEAYIAEAGRPDIIHAQSYLTGAVAAEINRKLKIPFVYTERLSSVLSGHTRSRYMPLIKIALDHSASNTAVSPGLQKQLKQLTKKPIEIIPNFYDPEIFYADPKVEKYKSFTWITAGEPSHVKGLDILLDAYGQLRSRIGPKKMQLFLVDTIREKKQLMKIVQKYGLDDEIHWIGQVPQTSLAEFFRRSHGYISSSRVETFGKAIVEAIACGLPVIATKTVGAKYILNPLNENLLVEKDEPSSLSNAMERLMNSYASLSTSNAILAIADRFSESVVMDQWVDLYKQCAR